MPTISNPSWGTWGNSTTTMNPWPISSGMNNPKASAPVNKCTYNVLGEDIEIEGWTDSQLANTIATINVLGEPFYIELKKQKVYLPSKIEDFLKIKFRDSKIDNILKNKE